MTLIRFLRTVSGFTDSEGPTLLLLKVLGGSAGLDGADLRRNGRVNILKNGFGGIIEWRCNRNTSTDALEPIDERSCELFLSGI